MDYLEIKQELRKKVQERVGYSRDFTDEEVEEVIDEVFLEQENRVVYPVNVRRRLKKELFDSLRRLDILQIFVEDSSVTEIMINGLERVFIEQGGQLKELDIRFEGQVIGRN